MTQLICVITFSHKHSIFFHFRLCLKFRPKRILRLCSRSRSSCFARSWERISKRELEDPIAWLAHGKGFQSVSLRVKWLRPLMWNQLSCMSMRIEGRSNNTTHYRRFVQFNYARIGYSSAVGMFFFV